MLGIKNFTDFMNYVGLSILWTIIFALITAISGFWKVPKIVRQLLKENRAVIGNGLGKHYADRFIEIWYGKNSKYIKGRFYVGASNAMLSPNKSQHYQEVIDRELVKLKLAIIENNDEVIPIRSLRNKIIRFIVQGYLVHCIGDDKNYYKSLRAGMKRRK